MYFNSNGDNLGPGAYKTNYKHVSTQRRVPEYTIGRHIADHPLVMPGVGTYNIGRDGNTNPKYTMAKHLPPIIYTEPPGPGAYDTNPAQKHVRMRHPHHAIATLIENHPFLTPGVGTYNIGRDGNTAPKHTMAQHLPPIIYTQTLGPGAYDMDPAQKHVRVWHPHHAIATLIEDHPFLTPRVGAYNIGRDGNTAPKYTMAQRFVEKPSTTPGPGYYSPDRASSAPAYTIRLHIEDHPFLTPGMGTYNMGRDGNTSPAFTMGMRFERLRDKLKDDKHKDKRYHAMLKQRPLHRSAGNSPACSRVGTPILPLLILTWKLFVKSISFAARRVSRPWTKPASPPLMIAAPAMKQQLVWTRPSTWDITAPLVMRPRPRPMSTTENILRRIHYKRGPTEDPQYNEYIREMYRYMGNKGVRYGRIPKWATSSSFIKATSRNMSFISRSEYM